MTDIEEVEVPAGKFTAIRVESEVSVGSPIPLLRFKLTEWYAPGVGLVKMIGRYDNSVATRVLKSFTPDGK